VIAALAPFVDDATAASGKPNIIFILADDLGYGDLGCYGGQFVPTPNIDQMAREGIRFTQHYAGSTVCAPSRACLLTGHHTGHVFQRANGNIEFRPDPQDACIARLLKNAGYTTAMIGKSGLSCNSDNGQLPNEKGFDYFFGFTSHAAAHRHYPKWLWRNGEKVYYEANAEKEGQQYSGNLFIEDSLQFIEKNAEGPFFLHMALQQPHADLNVPDKWREPFLAKFKEVPFAGNHYRAEPQPKATFAGMVTHLDASVGRVLTKLRELGIDKNSLVLFASDNGAMSEGGWRREYFKSSGPLRGGKRDLYEGGIRAPLICWWPGMIAAGKASDHVSAFWDFLPTACELAGVNVSVPTDGISYLPTLLGKAEQREHDHLYWEFYEEGGKQAVRRGDWKAVRLNVLDAGEGRSELYNLRDDLSETNDVAAEHPEIVAELAALMAEAHEGHGEYRMRP
jgi:arylsulfatase A-like enzyme